MNIAYSVDDVPEKYHKLQCICGLKEFMANLKANTNYYEQKQQQQQQQHHTTHISWLLLTVDNKMSGRVKIQRQKLQGNVPVGILSVSTASASSSKKKIRAKHWRSVDKDNRNFYYSSFSMMIDALLVILSIEISWVSHECFFFSILLARLVCFSCVWRLACLGHAHLPASMFMCLTNLEK